MTYWYKTFFILLITQTCWATQFDGLIVKYRSKLSVIDQKTKQKLTLTFQNTETEKQISKLSTNDFISFEGIENLQKKTVQVSSLNYVGLHSLIGRWTGDDHLCYEFINFTEILISLSEKQRCNFKNKDTTNTRSMTYTVNPTSAGWIALVSDSSASYAAEIERKSLVRVDLSLYDSESGDILGKIILKK